MQYVERPPVPVHYSLTLLIQFSECRVALVTTADLAKPPGESIQERYLSRKVYAQAVEDAPEHFYTQDLQWDQVSTHTHDNDSFMPLNRPAEWAADGKIGSASPRFHACFRGAATSV